MKFLTLAIFVSCSVLVAHEEGKTSLRRPSADLPKKACFEKQPEKRAAILWWLHELSEKPEKAKEIAEKCGINDLRGSTYKVACGDEKDCIEKAKAFCQEKCFKIGEVNPNGKLSGNFHFNCKTTGQLYENILIRACGPLSKANQLFDSMKSMSDAEISKKLSEIQGEIAD